MAELVATSALIFRVRVLRQKAIANYLRNNSLRKLQLGAGMNLLHGWLNSDGFEPASFTTSLKDFRGDILLDVQTVPV